MDRYKTYAVLTLVALIWAGTFIVTNLIVQEIPPIVGAFVPFFISGTVLLAVLFLSQKKRVSLRRDDLVRLFILGFSGIFLYTTPLQQLSLKGPLLNRWPYGKIFYKEGWTCQN